MYTSCRLCPRNCGVNRFKGETGLCGESAALRIGTVVIHHGEEPPLVGNGGSGTVFVSGCNLGCNFCQNYQVSHENALGKIVDNNEFVKICSELIGKGAENINIVTGSHAIPALADAFNAAKKAEVNLPVLWNTSAYENTDALELLKDHVDVFLPDLKTLDSEIAGKYFNAPDYPSAAKTAIKKMIDMKNNQEKVIIRHLILPGYIDSTYSVLRWFAENAAGNALLSLMTQYTPIPGRNKPMPDRFLNKEEYETVLYFLKELGIEEGFCQELVTGSDWLPDFRRFNPFSSELSVPVWNYNSQI